MITHIRVNASAMQDLADSTRRALNDIGDSRFDRVDDCGSPIVSQTVDFFLTALENALAEAKKTSDALAANIEGTIDDFTQREAAAEAGIQSLVDAVEKLY